MTIPLVDSRIRGSGPPVDPGSPAQRPSPSRLPVEKRVAHLFLSRSILRHAICSLNNGCFQILKLYHDAPTLGFLGAVALSPWPFLLKDSRPKVTCTSKLGDMAVGGSATNGHVTKKEDPSACGPMNAWVSKKCQGERSGRRVSRFSAFVVCGTWKCRVY